MAIVSSTFAFIVSLLCVFYLVFKFKYFRENKENIQKKRFKNVVDVTLSVTILIFSAMHVNFFLNSLQSGRTPQSFMNYIIVFILIYFAWVFVNVKMYRQEVEAAEKLKKTR